jgi:hypothetical protein
MSAGMKRMVILADSTFAGMPMAADHNHNRHFPVLFPV